MAATVLLGAATAMESLMRYSIAAFIAFVNARVASAVYQSVVHAL